jgi:hypothetical protein
MTDATLDRMIEKIKLRKELTPTGFCHHCEARFLPFSQQRFCDGHCRESFETAQRKGKKK